MPPVTTPGSIGDLVSGEVDDALGDLPVATDTTSIDVNDTEVSGQVRLYRRGYTVTNSAVRVNTASEVSLFAVPVTGTWDLPANSLIVGDLIRIRLLGQVTNNTGSDRTVIFKLTADGSTVWTFTTPAMPTSASSRVYYFDCELPITDFIGTRMGVTGFATMAAAGGGTTANLYTLLPLLAALPTVDLTQVISLDFRAQMSTNSNNFNLTPAGSPAEFSRLQTAA